MIILAVIFIIIWLYVLSVLRRSHLGFFKFIVGSVGLFFLLISLQSVFINYLTQGVSILTGILGKLTGIYESYYKYSMLLITNEEMSISLYIDYECSGVIEMIAFSSMLWFFPVYQLIEKVIINMIGVIWILLSNVIRIFSICLMVYFWGNNVYYFAHTIVGRLVFYVLSITLYFIVFTKSQMIRQKVGGFSYEQNNKSLSQ